MENDVAESDEEICCECVVSDAVASADASGSWSSLENPVSKTAPVWR
jgi:hypothetical protein